MVSVGPSATPSSSTGVSGAEPHWWSARALAEHLRAGELSAVEALEVVLSRVEARNDEINVVVTLEAERARAEAADIDRRRADPVLAAALGPLAGVPITVKDSMMVEGIRTTSGAPELADYVAEYDAVTVASLRRAGAVVYGKTNLPIWAGDVQSFNDVFGTSNNPWDVSRSVGGSSGGSAGALAAGFTSLEIGSDIAGSIRNPAAMCGVVGHKPSYGIVSGRGQIPGPPGTYTQADIAVVGPMARTVDDCELALDLMAGPDDWQSPAWSLDLPSARRPDIEGLRVAVWADDPYCPVDPEIVSSIGSLGEELASSGAVVDDSARPDGFDFAKADRTFDMLLGAAMCGGYPRAEIEAMAEQLRSADTVPGGLGVHGATMRHREWLTHNERRLQMRAAWRAFFDDWDVVLAPVSPTVAIPHDHSHPMTDRSIDVAGQARSYMDQMRWMGLVGAVYLPATAVPIGMHSTGLPMAVQIIGPFLEDRTCLAAARVIERIRGGFRVPAGW